MTVEGDVPEFGQPDSRTAEDREADAATAAAQYERAQRRWSDRDSRIVYMERLVERRNSNEQRLDEPIELVLPDDRRELLVMRGELLTTAEALRDDTFLELLRGFGWMPADPRQGEDCLGDRIARLRWETEKDRTDDGLADLQDQSEYPVTLSYVHPFGAVMKGGETPELTHPDVPVRPAPGERGSTAVAVIDTGIAFQERSDGWLMDLLSEGEEDQLDVLPPPRDDFLDAGAGHGSFVAGVVQQIVPDARIKVYQALDTDGLASDLRVACTLVRAVREMLEDGGRLVVNLSLGTDTVDDMPPLAFEAALDVIDDIQAERKGEVLVVAAAGNGFDTRPCWPGAFDRVIAVGALEPDLTPASFSTRGPWVDCSTVGVGVRSTYVEGRESPDFDPQGPEVWGPDSWGQWLGTSFAAPQVAGAVAKLAEESGSSLRLALQTLLRGAPRLPGFGRTVRILG